jgi:photosystem II stability/assembly factor-like uncharacterized protein
MVVEHPSGALFVAGYGGPRATLWKSTDRGATWVRVDVGGEAEGTLGNSDVDLAVSYDGTLYFAGMLFDNQVNEGRQIAVAVSRDVGVTWSWALVSKMRFDDRPWVKVAPDGTAHVIWNDGSGINHAVSRDHGATWTREGRVYEKGGSSHLAIGPAGEVAVRVTPASASGGKFDPGVDLIAVSRDAGATWATSPAPGHREWKSADDDRWVEPLAWDARGALYSFWADGRQLWLARSADSGRTWVSWQVAEASDTAYFPYLVARGRGELAATWSFGRAEGLQWRLAHLVVGDGRARPRVTLSAPYRTDSWVRPPGQPTGELVRSPAGEYLAVTFLLGRSLGVVTPIQVPGRARFGFSWWMFALR